MLDLSAPIAANATSHYTVIPQPSVVLSGEDLTIGTVGRVARGGAPVQITDDEVTLQRVQASCDYIMDTIAKNLPIYGVTSGFGGMAHVAIDQDAAFDLQDNLIWYHKAGSGRRLSRADVRAAMLLRANSHLRGASGIRLEVIRRIERFLNANVTPHVYEFGSIGASGDLVPLSYITGALIGLDPCYSVDFDGEELDALTALERLDLPRLHLRPKEGLAMINGTSVMTGIAANVLCDAHQLFTLTLGIHALMIQALGGTNQSFHPFIHALKPHPGQVWSAARMLELLDGSQLIRDEIDGRHDHRKNDLIQDRYSLRCLPQYMGPLFDGLREITTQIETEINSATDNPLIDVDAYASYHGGNFLGQYVGIGMDRLRSMIGLLAKHLDTQIALLVASEFNNGLAPCLIGNTGRSINMGLKGLQIAGNSIMPMLTFLGNSIADHFPTHAEQFNQNINSQGFNSANLARQSVDVLRQYLALG
ncbi:MAG: aromatic amino acid lyase, partial [Chloroflexi bacterium]|nr:aromatic amino acid lyase [Chloroflexota bacterium]